MKLAVVDLDGVVADNTARFAKAEEAKQAFLSNNEKSLDAILSGSSAMKEATNLFWQTAFTPELVSLDTIMPGAKEALQTLRFGHYDRLIFLTSRPESMRLATVNWLFNQNILFYVPDGHRSVVALVMKAPAFQYTKTTIWKTGMVETLAALYGASEVLFVDDEAANTEMLMNTWNNDKISLRCCTSLEMAVKGFTEF